MTRFVQLFGIFVGSDVFIWLLTYFVPFVIIGCLFSLVGVLIHGKFV